MFLSQNLGAAAGWMPRGLELADLDVAEEIALAFGTGVYLEADDSFEAAALVAKAGPIQGFSLRFL